MSEHGDPVPVLPYAGPTRNPAVPDVFALGPVLLVVRRGVELPNRCIICNGAPSGVPKRMRLRWVPREVGESFGDDRTVPLIGLFVMLGRLIESLIRGRTATLRVPLCSKHRTRHLLKRIAWWLYLPMGPVLIWVGIKILSPLLVLVGMIATVSCLAMIELYPRLLRAVRIDKEHVVVLGAGQPFRAQLPHSS